MSILEGHWLEEQMKDLKLKENRPLRWGKVTERKEIMKKSRIDCLSNKQEYLITIKNSSLKYNIKIDLEKDNVLIEYISYDVLQGTVDIPLTAIFNLVECIKERKLK